MASSSSSTSHLPKATKRIIKEIAMFKESPPQYITKIHFNDSNVRTLHFLIDGPPDTPYFNGQYVLKMDIKETYPIEPPVISMLTPSGRFEPGVTICTSFTHFHKETWSPIYNFITILVSMLSFMTDNTKTEGIGGMVTTNEVKNKLASESKAYNTRKGYDKMFLDSI